MNMADETVQKDPPSTAIPPPNAQERPEQPSGPVHEPKLEADSVTEPPLASVSLDLQKYSADLGPAEEEHLKEAVAVVEKDTPLEAPPPEPLLATERVTVTAPSGKVSRSLSLYDALALSQEPEEVVTTPLSEKNASKKKAAESFASFKEESNKLSDLSPSELKALQGFRGLVREGLKNGVFSDTSEEEVSIWGIPMLKDDRTDVILLKFLRARDFKVEDSLAMLKNALKWRRDFNVNDELLKEDLGDDLEKIVFMHGHDKDGHPVCYNVYGEFQDKELYARTFSDEEKRMNFLRWRIQFLEKRIRKLDFSPGGINTIFQISDLKNSPGPGKKELRIATRLALHMLQDNYPEFVAKQVFINVPWWYLAFYTMMSPFLTQRTKSKFVFASPSRTAQTLFKYISPEQVPIQYGGLNVDRCECNPEFTVDDPATEITVKPATKQTVEIIVKEKCTLVWELRVVGWEVSYTSEYVPDTERQYTVIIQKTRKMAPSDEPVISSSFDVSELGKILLAIDNPTAKKKTLLYRFKVVPLRG